jgi:hypothetical protein
MTSGTVAKWKDLYTKYNPMNANKPASIADIAFDTGVIAERERILKILCNKGMELEKDVSWDDEASHIRYVFMCDLIKLVRESK